MVLHNIYKCVTYMFSELPEVRHPSRQGQYHFSYILVVEIWQGLEIPPKPTHPLIEWSMDDKHWCGGSEL